MKVWAFYALWVNRNGMHLWQGPYTSEDQASGALDMITDARATGSGFVLRRSVDDEEETP